MHYRNEPIMGFSVVAQGKQLCFERACPLAKRVTTSEYLSELTLVFRRYTNVEKISAGNARLVDIDLRSQPSIGHDFRGIGGVETGKIKTF